MAQSCKTVSYGSSGVDIRSIMAIVDGGIESKNVLMTAIELGQRFDAVTMLLQVTPPSAQFIYPSLEASSSQAINDIISGMEKAVEDRKVFFETLYNKEVIDAGVPTVPVEDISNTVKFAISKETIIGHDNREIAERGRLFDLIVIGMPNEDSGGVDSAALEAALLDTARPVLITCKYPRPIVGGHITIAWDGSREAAQSIRNALPLMAGATNIEVVHVVQEGMPESDPDDICKYLRMHGIVAKARKILSHEGNIGDALLNAARGNSHALLIMGAYGSSAVAEYIFGGATRAVMTKADIPLLVSH